MLPRPLRTRRVSRRRLPRYLETASACSGEAMSGSVAISTSGIPSLSKEYVTSCPSEFVSSPSFLAESSSRQITDIPTSTPSTSNFPSVATSVVRWNPLVFEPSTTVFLITWRWGAGVASSMAEICRVVASATGSSGRGGASSNSIRPEFGVCM